MSTAGTKGVPRAVRETQFLDIAADQIARTGYAGLSMKDVVAQAGVSKPLVYAYFDTKDGLYIACVERAARILSGAIESAAAGSARERARETLRSVFTALEPRPSDWGVLLDRSHPVEGPAAEAARNARGRIAAQTREGVAAALASSGMVVDEAALSALTGVWLSTVTTIVDWWLRHPDISADVMVDRGQELIDNLVRVAAAASTSANGATILALADKVPTIDETAWVAPNATIIGNVEIGAGSSVWYRAVLRADMEAITVGERSNIQDGCVMHADPGSALRVGAGVSVGHNATLHGCTIEDDVLVGVGATILDAARIGRGSIIAANVLIPQGADIPAGSLVAGVPGEVRRSVTADELADIRATGTSYEQLREQHRHQARVLAAG